MQTLNIDLDYEVKVIGKTFTLLKQKDIMLNSMTQTREKWDSLVFSRGDFWMIWRYHGILCIHLYFLFRNNVWREQLDKNNFCHCYSFFYLFIYFFWKCYSESTWLQLRSEFFLNNYEALWQQHLKDTLQLKILRTWMSSLHQGI